MSDPAPWLPFDLVGQLGADDVSQQLFAHRLVTVRARYQQSADWETQARTLEHLDGLAYLGEHRGAQDAFLSDGQGPFAYVWLASGRVIVRCAGATTESTRRLMRDIAEAIPKTELTEELAVPVTFWSLTAQGPRERTRMIDVATWDDVRGNYPTATREPLGAMVEAFTPGRGGQLVLWQGPPGTGKTWALRALAWEWREWCRLHYIADPDQFFAEHAEYMLEVLLHGDGEDGPAPVVGDDPEPSGRDQWRLLVLEDTGELLTADAKERMGQGLSRLLNVVDGLIGQGLRVVVLVTTNEEMRTLHPAVSRPGRCAAAVEFGGFTRDEAAFWLADHEVEARHDGPRTLAELYAIEAGLEAPTAPPVGFAR